MKRTSFVVFLLALLVQGAGAFEPPVYDESTLRTVHSFDLAGPEERTGGSADSWTYSNQDILERMVSERERETFLQKTYFNGTSEAKAYALVGLSVIKSALYVSLKTDFLEHERQLTIKCRVKGLKSEETPSAVVAAIDSGALPSRIRPTKK